jgi:hypothetical protein
MANNKSRYKKKFPRQMLRLPTFHITPKLPKGGLNAMTIFRAYKVYFLSCSPFQNESASKDDVKGEMMGGAREK